MLNKVFVEFLYEAAHIQRWNDHIRPNGFTELDKQAHKMMILYVLAKYEEQDHQAKLNWRVLIEGGIFEFLHRIVLTDIKPPVFHELMRVHGKKLNSWVYEELRQRYLIWILFLWLKCKDILTNRRKIIWKRNFCVLHIIWLLSGNLVLFIISIREFTVLRKRKRL